MQISVVCSGVVLSDMMLASDDLLFISLAARPYFVIARGGGRNFSSAPACDDKVGSSG